MTTLWRALRGARWAIVLAACLPVPLRHVRADTWQTVARVTWYDQGTITADGSPVYVGEAACSTDLPFGAVVVFPDGFTVTCHDRGDLGDGSPVSWIDCYGADWLPAEYGSDALVTVEE